MSITGLFMNVAIFTPCYYTRGFRGLTAEDPFGVQDDNGLLSVLPTPGDLDAALEMTVRQWVVLIPIYLST